MSIVHLVVLIVCLAVFFPTEVGAQASRPGPLSERLTVLRVGYRLPRDTTPQSEALEPGLGAKITKSALSGALLGGLAGAAVKGLRGGDDQTVLLGALAGATLGAIWAILHHTSPWLERQV